MLPLSFTQYLNTTFLGPRKFVEAGSVNYTYFQFGPFNLGTTGKSLSQVAYTSTAHASSVHCICMPNFGMALTALLQLFVCELKRSSRLTLS